MKLGIVARIFFVPILLFLFVLLLICLIPFLMVVFLFATVQLLITGDINISFLNKKRRKHGKRIK